MKNILILITIAVSMLIYACSIDGHRGGGEDNYFSDFKSMPDACWLYDEGVVFTADTLRDSIATGSLILALRHSAAYPYRNVYIELQYNERPDSSIKDTFNIILADIYGHWRGKGMGSSLMITDTLYKRFQLAQNMPLNLRHILRVDTLEGIEQVGLTFIPD